MNSKIKPIRIHRAQIALAAAFTCLVGSAFADQTHVTYSLAAGATRAINVPASNTPIQVSCSQNAIGNVSVGQATIIRSTTDNVLNWAGFDNFSNAVSRGNSATPGAHIIYCDLIGQVDIEVLSATEVQVKNTTLTTQSGVVMFVY